MSEYYTRRIGAENFDMLVPLMKDCFGMEVNIDYFQWKYMQNPAGNFIGFVAIHSKTGELGAYYGVIPQNLVINGKETLVYQSCDTMTDSRHRRQGLFKMLAMECYQYLRSTNQLFIIGFGGADSTPGFIKFGWKHVIDFRYCFKPALLCKLSLLTGYAQKDFSSGANKRDLDEVISQAPLQQAIHSRRTSQHVLWRINNPNRKCQTVFFKEKGIATGYAVYYVDNNKLVLLDFLFNTPESRKALLWSLARLVNREGYKAIIGYCQRNGFMENQLRKSSFFNNPFKRGPLTERTPFIFFGEEADMAEFGSANAWQMTSYDHDAF